MSGYTTFLIGTEDGKVEAALEIISKYGKKRTVPSVVNDAALAMGGIGSVESQAGGGIVFVLNIEQHRTL